MSRWALFSSALFCTALQLPAQTHANGVVSGTVVNAATGVPVPDALVVLRVSYAGYGFRDRPGDRPSSGDMARAVTDKTGNFTIEFDPALPASRLFVSRDGFRSEDDREIVTIPLLPAGARNVTVALVPQSAIQGRVADREGAPLTGVVVRAIRVDIQDGRRQLRNNYSVAVSGADGTYRLASLAPGSYYLEAFGTASDRTHGYGPLYFPEANGEASAQALQTKPGETLNADFELSSHPLFKIRGVLNNIPPERHVEIRLLRGEDPQNNSMIVNVGNKSFEIDDVAPGSYVVQAFTPENIPADFGEAEVAVSDRDPAPIKIALNPAVDVHGRIDVAGARRPERFAYVTAIPLSSYPPLRIPPLSRAMMIADGSFILRNLLPGKYDLTVRLLPGSYVAGITADSQGGAVDVQQDGFTVGPGRPPELKIVIHRGGGEIEGALEGAEQKGALPIVLVHKSGTARSVTVVTAERGRFLMSGLAPGDYDLYALPPSVAVEYRNPEVLEALSQFAGHATVRDGLRETVTLRLVPESFAAHPVDGSRASK